MIRCKARFHIALLCFCIAICFLSPLHAQAYLAPRLYAFDRGVYDYTQKHLSDKLHYLLSHSQFSVEQGGYAQSSGTFMNVQVATDFKLLANLLRFALLPDTFDSEFYNTERTLVLFYESLSRRWERLNPVPGLYYTVIIRNSAYPFLSVESINKDAQLLGTFPFMDDGKARLTLVWEQQFAFGFRILF